MKNAMDAEQSRNRVLEITPFIPLILRGREKETIPILRIPLLRLVLAKARIRGARGVMKERDRT